MLNSKHYRAAINKLSEKFSEKQELPSILAKSSNSHASSHRKQSVQGKQSELDQNQTELEELSLKKELTIASSPKSPNLEFYIHKTYDNDEVRHQILENENAIDLSPRIHFNENLNILSEGNIQTHNWLSHRDKDIIPELNQQFQGNLSN